MSEITITRCDACRNTTPIDESSHTVFRGGSVSIDSSRLNPPFSVRFADLCPACAIGLEALITTYLHARRDSERKTL